MLARYDASRPLAFIHIPKTSGVALSAGLTKALSCSSLVGKFDTAVFGDFNSFENLDPRLSAHLCKSWTEIPKDAGFIAGHFYASSLFKAYPEGQHITFLREARSRLLSQWLYWRQMTDFDLSWLGDFADRLKTARQPLEEFLADPRVAFATDNMMVRVLVSPHADVSTADFIDSGSDKRLLSAALEVLDRMSYVDVIENPHFRVNLQTWLGREFAYDVANRTERMPEGEKSPLHTHFTERAEALLYNRTRVDRRLWRMLLQAKLPGCDRRAIERASFSRTIARFSALMSGG